MSEDFSGQKTLEVYTAQQRMAATTIKAFRSSIRSELKDGLRPDLLELAERCPLHHTNPQECPLFRLRTMEPRKRRQWFNSLSEADLSYLAAYHQVCLAVRVEAELAEASP